MALYRLRLIGLHTGTLQLEDYMSMSWGIDAAGPPDLAAVHADFVAIRALPSASTNWGYCLQSGWGTFAWELRAASGGPVLDYLEVARVLGTGGGQPATVTLPVQSVVAAGARVKRVGRLHLGPFGGSTISYRPTTTHQTAALNFCEYWHARLLALGCTPTYLSNGGTTGEPIIGYAVGNAWGQLRSRKSEPTARTVRML